MTGEKWRRERKARKDEVQCSVHATVSSQATFPSAWRVECACALSRLLRATSHLHHANYDKVQSYGFWIPSSPHGSNSSSLPVCLCHCQRQWPVSLASYLRRVHIRNTITTPVNVSSLSCRQYVLTLSEMWPCLNRVCACRDEWLVDIIDATAITCSLPVLRVHRHWC